jgi:hypothetical protein
MKAYTRRGSRGIALLILNLDPRWRYIVNITLRPPYYRKRTPRSRSKRFWRKRKSLAPFGIRNPDPLARSESLYRLCYPGCHKFFTERIQVCAIAYFSVSQYRCSSPDKVQSTNQRPDVRHASITYTTYVPLLCSYESFTTDTFAGYVLIHYFYIFYD